MEVAPFTHLESLATLAEPEDLSGTESVAAEPLAEPAANHITVSPTKLAVEPEPEPERLLFGWGGCTPACLQPLVSQRTFLLVFVVTCVLQGMYYTYVVSVLTTIEKLFQFQSKTTGILFSATEIGQISGALLLTYYGGQGHRPRWIGCGITLFALCAFLCSMPHFMYGGRLVSLNELHTGGNGSSHPTLCARPDVVTAENVTERVLFADQVNASRWPHTTPGATAEPVGCEDSVKLSTYAEIQRVVLAIFFVCLIGVGVGQTMAFNLGIPYMDDNVSSKESPMYFAFIIGMRIFGPVFGFVLGSLCTSIYVYPNETPSITTRDPRWIGAWWLGMFIVSGMLVLNGIIMFGFPRRLPKPAAPAQLPSGPASQPVEPSASRANPSLRDFPRAVKHLLQNDVLMFRTASNVLHVLPIAGLYTFLPKYLETQFRLTANAANIMSGLGGILVMFLGILGSGFYIRRYQPSARFITGWIAIAALIYSAGMTILMFVGCHQDDFVGLQEGYGAQLFNTTCSAHCGCPTEEFSPVCGTDGFTYLAPCMAGCTDLAADDDARYEFGECSCVEHSTAEPASGLASLGYCPLDCENFYWFIPIFSVFVLIHSTSEVGAILITLRCVDPHEKALALGFIAVAIGLFGNVPCPIIYGAVIDSACLLWKKNCGRQGACLLYDTDRFRHFFFGITAAVMFAAFLVDCVVWYRVGKMDALRSADQPPLRSPTTNNRAPPEAAGQPETAPLNHRP